MKTCLIAAVSVAVALTVPAAGYDGAGPVQGPAAPGGASSGSAGITAQAPATSPDQTLVNRYCVGCHNTRTKSGGLVLAGLDTTAAHDAPEVWERVVRKMRNGLMPPAGAARPDDATYTKFLASLQDRLDASSAKQPDPGRTETAHRVNRLEYQNAVRDLLAVEMNVADLLPADDSSYGFDNIAGVLKMSPALMERYLAAARVISRSAVGSPPPAVETSIYRVSAETQQHDRQEDLPLGTRGGTLIRHVFPLNAEYEIKVGVTGGGASDQFEVSIDGAQIALTQLDGSGAPPLRLAVNGGPHDVGVTFFRRPPDLVEQVREPFQNPDAASNTGGPIGRVAAVSNVTITGPFAATGPGDTPSRRRVFSCRPSNQAQEAACAKTILTGLARRAYRESVLV